ncbi:YebO family protein [Erwiniaceae bacterium BAC15a-03b]|uniref:YebO family protein n=1 Tax=Winslowiella arboricola TaxID=2978220 RepID=A0A9J6PPI0_9GAMM|nr:YebO family protein [Winslowiella arboricola]MCU5775812.1 YebO family protein [Winslowiella arboricola]MCU5779338.1 YebO family protein [Winslowiella arboricola]
MNEMANGAMGLASMGFIAALVIVGLIAWFFVNRASVRASEQIRLLEALLDEQKKQNAMLRRLTDAVSGGEKSKAAAENDDDKDFTRLIPER